MARIEIEMAGDFIFETEMEVRMSEINTANHVGNDSFVSLINESRVRFLDDLDCPLGEDKGLIIADLAVSYKAQAFYKDRLKFEVGAGDFNTYGCDIFYRISNAETNQLVALAKNGVVFFDYLEKKVVKIPETFVMEIEKKALA